MSSNIWTTFDGNFVTGSFKKCPIQSHCFTLLATLSTSARRHPTTSRTIFFDSIFCSILFFICLQVDQLEKIVELFLFAKKYCLGSICIERILALGARHNSFDLSVAYHPPAPGSNPKHSINAFSVYSQIFVIALRKGHK